MPNQQGKFSLDGLDEGQGSFSLSDVDEEPTAATPPKPREETGTASQLLGAEFPGFVKAHPTIAGALGDMGDVAQGAGRELISQGGRLANYVSPRAGRALAPLIEEYGSPIPGASETAGRIGLNVGEFMVPGGAEADASRGIGEVLENAPALVREGARLLPAAAASGGINKLQGGSFTTGALAGAGGAAAGRIAAEAAPAIMRRSLGVTARQITHGATPGEEALQLPGVFPGTVKARAAEKAMMLTQTHLEPMLQQAEAQGTQIDLSPARREIESAMRSAEARNSRVVLERLKDLAGQLAEDTQGNPIPDRVTPTQARALKQGLDDTIGSWTAERGGISKRVMDATKSARAAIDGQLDRAIPGHSEVNQHIQSLIMASKGRGSGKVGIVTRLALPYIGYRVARGEGESPGRSAAVALGMEGLASPGAGILAAKTLASPGLIPLLRGGVLGAYNATLPPVAMGNIGSTRSITKLPRLPGATAVNARPAGKLNLTRLVMPTQGGRR